MPAPTTVHEHIVKHILCYLKGTLGFGLKLTADPLSLMVAQSDADWAGCLNSRRFTSSLFVFLGLNLLIGVLSKNK